MLGWLCLWCEFLAKSQPGPPSSGPLLQVYLPQVLTDWYNCRLTGFPLLERRGPQPAIEQGLKFQFLDG